MPRRCGGMMKKVSEAVLLLVLISFTRHAKGKRHSPPEKPLLIRCRSPEKETFTCWWEPGFDGGLPTTYALYYRKENSETVHECPDYHTAGKNSCFFNKNNTSIWVNYNITVVATNALGSTFSDPVDIDVVYIVKPNPPEKMTVTVMEDMGWPFLRVSWEPPHKADTRSGWITLIYELRIRLEGEDEWERHLAGQQKTFNIFSLRSGGTYDIQVRCKPDHGFWSEWSSTSNIKVPDYFHREKSMWILITVFAAFIFLILTWLLRMNSHRLKHCILPPVPGPKIRGFDKQLLKHGKSEEIFRALVVSDFPPTTSSHCEDLLQDYLEVYVPEEQELMLEESKDLHNNRLKSEDSTCDSDSGRGSCDSHTLLMDKCKEAKEEGSQTDQEGGPMQMEAQRHQRDWNEDAVNYAHQDISNGRVKTWPSVFSPLPQYSSNPLNQLSSLEMAKQHCFSDGLFPPASTSSYLMQPSHGTDEAHGTSYWDFCSDNKQPCPLQIQPQSCQQLQAHSDVNIFSNKQPGAGLQLRALRPNEYVEVERVNDDMVLLQPVASGRGCGEGCRQGEVYSKVKSVDSDNVLLLQREAMEEDMEGCPCETNGGTQSCMQDERAVAVNGYVDTSAVFTLPTY